MEYPTSILIVSLTALAPTLRAEVKLPATFSDHALHLGGTAVPEYQPHRDLKNQPLKATP